MKREIPLTDGPKPNARAPKGLGSRSTKHANLETTIRNSPQVTVTNSASSEHILSTYSRPLTSVAGDPHPWSQDVTHGTFLDKNQGKSPLPIKAPDQLLCHGMSRDPLGPREIWQLFRWASTKA